MRFIQRDPLDNAKIVGHFANEQDYAREAVPDDDPLIQAFDSQRGSKVKTLTEAFAEQQVLIHTLTARVVELERKTALMP